MLVVAARAESHASHSIALTAGATATVSSSATDGKADFVVSESSDCSEAEPAPFGTETGKGVSWVGQVPV